MKYQKSVPARLQVRHRYDIVPKSALAELGSTTGCLKAVLHKFQCSKSPELWAFLPHFLKVAPFFNSETGVLLCFISLSQRCIYYLRQFFRLIVLHLCIDVHSCFTVLMSCKILNRLRIYSCVQKICNVSVSKSV